MSHACLQLRTTWRYVASEVYYFFSIHEIKESLNKRSTSSTDCFLMPKKRWQAKFILSVNYLIGQYMSVLLYCHVVLLQTFLAANFVVHPVLSSDQYTKAKHIKKQLVISFPFTFKICPSSFLSQNSIPVLGCISGT